MKFNHHYIIKFQLAEASRGLQNDAGGWTLQDFRLECFKRLEFAGFSVGMDRPPDPRRLDFGLPRASQELDFGLPRASKEAWRGRKVNLEKSQKSLFCCGVVLGVRAFSGQNGPEKSLTFPGKITKVTILLLGGLGKSDFCDFLRKRPKSHFS